MKTHRCYQVYRVWGISVSEGQGKTTIWFLFKSHSSVGWNNCVLKRWGEGGGAGPAWERHAGGMTVGECGNLMAHEGCGDCWFRPQRTLDDRWKHARKQTRDVQGLEKQHTYGPSAGVYGPVAQRARTMGVSGGKRQPHRNDYRPLRSQRGGNQSRGLHFFHSHSFLLPVEDRSPRKRGNAERCSTIALTVCARGFITWYFIS